MSNTSQLLENDTFDIITITTIWRLLINQEQNWGFILYKF